MEFRAKISKSDSLDSVSRNFSVAAIFCILYRLEFCDYSRAVDSEVDSRFESGFEAEHSKKSRGDWWSCIRDSHDLFHANRGSFSHDRLCLAIFRVISSTRRESRASGGVFWNRAIHHRDFSFHRSKISQAESDFCELDSADAVSFLPSVAARYSSELCNRGADSDSDVRRDLFGAEVFEDWIRNFMRTEFFAYDLDSAGR